MPDQPTITIASEHVALGPLRSEYMAQSVEWANNLEVARPRGLVLKPYTLEDIAAWRATSRAASDVIFTIYDRVTMQPIGEAGFTNLSLFHRNAEYTIFIGEDDFRGKGYGTETTRLLLDYGFLHLNLHNIWLRVNSTNAPALRVYNRAGFHEAGLLRETQLIEGRWTDTVYMEYLAADYFGR